MVIMHVVMLALLTLDAAPSSEKMRGSKLYDALYATGYHANLHTTRARDILPAVANLSSLLGVDSVLDVGCSHGFAVNWLWNHGFHASGVDVSSIAVAKAKAARGEPAEKCIAPCFAQGSATKLPWADGAFGAVMSTDVLEHLQADEVDTALKELTRVASKMMILKIAQRGDTLNQKQKGAMTAIGEAAAALPDDLHPMVRRPSWWIRRIEALSSFRKLKVLPTPAGRPWMCCTTVFVRPADVAS